MDDENQEVADLEEDSFDEFAEAADNGTAVPEVTESEEVEEDSIRFRDEMGRFASAGNEEDDSLEGSPEQSPEAEAPQGINWEQKANELEHRYKSDIGRQNALQRKIAEQNEEILRLQTAAPSTNNPESSGMSDSEWDALKEDFPEVAAGIEARLQSVSGKYEQEISQLRSQMQPIQQNAEKQYRDSQVQLLEQAHPDWADIRQSSDFSAWLNQQPAIVQDLKKSQSADDARWMLDQFKLAQGFNTKQQQQDDLNAKRQRQLRSAQTVSRRGVINQDLDSDDSLFDHFAAKADKKRRA